MNIYGKNAVRLALKNGKGTHLYLTEERRDFKELAESRGIPYTELSAKELTKMANTANHQGVVLAGWEYRYGTLADMAKDASLIVLLDGVEDPRNLGAIIRTCDAAGAGGVIIRNKRSVHITPEVVKASTGAIEHVRVASVVNLTSAIDYLKSQGFLIVGAERKEESIDYCDFAYSFPLCLVLGSEGKGISRLVLKQCDELIAIPMVGTVNSLNVSVACGVLLYEIIKKKN